MTEATDRIPNIAVVLNRDLLFGSRIRNVIAGLGLEAQFVASANDFINALHRHGDSAAIGIIDMNAPLSWDVIGEMYDRTSDDVPPTLAFGPHVDVESRRAAKAAGVTRIVSNGQFHGDMAGLIERYRRR